MSFLSFKTMTTGLLLTTCLATAALCETRIKSVELGQAGIARYDFDATVDGTILSFTVPQSAASDVLASLVVRDPLGGVIDLQTDTPGSVGAALAGTPFASGLPHNTADLLRTLVGRDVSVETRTGPYKGRLLGVGDIEVAEHGQTVLRPTALLHTDAGMVELIIGPGSNVQFDTGLMNQLAEASAERLSHAAAREFELTLSSADERTIGLSYVTESAAWKNSWRLLLQEGRLQGWATLENMSGEDWDGIALTLTTGTPVTYARSLIDPLFLPRPTLDTPSPQQGARMVQGLNTVARSSTHSGVVTMSSPQPLAEAARELRQVTENGILRYALPEGITLEDGRTANLMYLDVPIDPEIRGYLKPGHPLLLAVSLSPDQPLAAGLISVQGANGFVGDALFDGMQSGQSRLLPYAHATGADVTTDADSTFRIISATSLEDGVSVSLQKFRTTRYAAELPPEIALFSVDHLAEFGRFHDSTGDMKRVGNAYRVTVPVTDGKATVRISEKRDQVRVLQYSASEFASLVASIKSGQTQASPEVTTALEQGLALSRELDRFAKQKAAAQETYDRLFKEQGRLRENLQTVELEQLKDRLLKTLSDAEIGLLNALETIETAETEEKRLRLQINQLFE